MVPSEPSGSAMSSVAGRTVVSDGPGQSGRMAPRPPSESQSRTSSKADRGLPRRSQGEVGDPVGGAIPILAAMRPLRKARTFLE